MKLSTFLSISALALNMVTAAPIVVAAGATANPTSDTGVQASGTVKQQNPASPIEQKMSTVARADPAATGNSAVKKTPWTDNSRHFHPRDGK